MSETQNLSNLLSDYVKERLQVKDIMESIEDTRVRFTISLDSFDNCRLEYIAKEAGVKKTQLVADATMLLVKAFEKELGLSLTAPEYLEKITSD